MKSQKQEGTIRKTRLRSKLEDRIKQKNVETMIEQENDQMPEQLAQSQPATEVEEVKQPCLKKSRKLNPLPVGRPVRVYADGIFDMYHFGHARMLQQAKNVFPDHEVHLIVGVCDDELTHKMKGKTVMTEQERYESVRHCKHVDEVVESAPWILTPEFLSKHKIDYVAHDDDPYPDASGTAVDVYDFVRAAGMFVATKRTDGISTSDIITRIVKDYDQFVKRNLARGYSRKDMNVSYLKETRIKVAESVGRIQGQVEAQVDELRNNVRDNVSEISDNIAFWMDNSQRHIEEFMKLFGKDGQIKRIISQQSQRFSLLAKNTPM